MLSTMDSKSLAPPVVAVIITGGVSATAVVTATRDRGLSLSPDSVQYIAGAHSLALGQGFFGIDGHSQVLYPPGLSFLLVPGYLVGHVAAWELFLNICLTSITTIAVGLYLARVIRPALAVGAAITTGLSFPIILVATWAWSEPLYNYLVLFYLAMIAHLRCARRTITASVLIGLVAGAGFTVRYSAISLLPVGLGAICIIGRPLRNRIVLIMAYFVGFVVPAGPLLIRNLVTSGTLAGERLPNSLSVGEVIISGATTVVNWFIPVPLPSIVRAVVLLVVICSSVVSAAGAARFIRNSTDQRAVMLAAAASYVATSFVALVVMASRTNIDPLSDRLLSPVTAPLVVILFVLVDVSCDYGRRYTVAAAILVTFPAVTLMGRTAWVVGTGSIAAGGYQSSAWHSTAVQQLVTAPPENATVISNQPWGVYAITGRAIIESPRQHAYASNSRTPDDLRKVLPGLQRNTTYLVWINSPGEYHLTPEQLGAYMHVQEMASTEAGAVYLLS